MKYIFYITSSIVFDSYVDLEYFSKTGEIYDLYSVRILRNYFIHRISIVPVNCHCPKTSSKCLLRMSQIWKNHNSEKDEIISGENAWGEMQEK